MAARCGQNAIVYLERDIAHEHSIRVPIRAKACRAATKGSGHRAEKTSFIAYAARRQAPSVSALKCFLRQLLWLVEIGVERTGCAPWATASSTSRPRLNQSKLRESGEMPTSLNMSLLPIKDPRLVEIISSLAPAVAGVRIIRFTWSLLEGQDSNSCEVHEIKSNSQLAAVLAQDGEILRTAGINFQTDQGNGSMIVTRDASGSLSLSINLPPNFDNNPAAKTKIVIEARQAFQSYRRSAILDSLHPLMSEFYDRREATLLRLEELNAKITIEADEHRRKLDQSYEKTKQELEATITTRVQELETEYTAKEEELSKKAAALSEREKILL